MAQQLYVVTHYGGGWANMPRVDGMPVLPCVTLTPGEDASKEYRLRPTGEKGSGPYFHSYVKPENGVSHGWKVGGIIYADQMDYSEEVVDDRVGSHYPLAVKKTFSNGEYYWEYQYQYYFSTRSWKWQEQADCFIVRWNGPLDPTDASLYPRCWQYRDGWSWSHTWDVKPTHAVFKDWCWEQASDFIALSLSKDIEKDGRVAEMVNNARSGKQPLPFLAKVDNFGWKYGEATCFEWYRITGFIPPLFQSLGNAAYVEACDSLPEAGCNSIANVLEIAGTLSSLLHGKANSLRSIKDVWLQYRYVMCTTKMDVDEYCEVTRRLVNLANQEKVTVYGQAQYGDIVCTCSIDVRLDKVLPEDTASWLKAYGFKFSAVNMWDMIPYSFVVDWFLHVGEILETIEKYGKALEVPVEDCWFSFRSKYGNQDTFLRVPGAYSAAFPYISLNKTSSKTVFKRILDAICLFT